MHLPNFKFILLKDIKYLYICDFNAFYVLCRIKKNQKKPISDKNTILFHVITFSFRRMSYFCKKTIMIFLLNLNQNLIKSRDFKILVFKKSFNQITH